MDYQTRRQLQSDHTRRAILDAAAKLTKEKGFEKVSVRDICRCAGVTTGAFYHHFTSKEDLLNQGFASMDAFMERALEGSEALPPLERLEKLLRLYAAFMEDQGWETVALYYGRRLADPAAESMSPSRYTLRAMADCLNTLARQGILSPDYAPQWTAEFLFRHFRGVVIDWILHRGSYPLWPRLNQDYQLFNKAFRA